MEEAAGMEGNAILEKSGTKMASAHVEGWKTNLEGSQIP
jgi:hypothetical protein